MKTRISIVLLCCISIVFSQKKDHRTFQQIVDSIMVEADLIYGFDRAFFKTTDSLEQVRNLRNLAGEVVAYQKNDSLFAIVLDKKLTEKVLATFKYGYADDIPEIDYTARYMDATEKNVYNMKHKVMADIDANYELAELKPGQFYNPIFIPFKEKIHGIERQMYKLYVLTETAEQQHIPFGQDYLFYADDTGKVFYYLHFNEYLPISVTQEMIDDQKIEIIYGKKEPYILPTDIMLFRKYGLKFELNELRVKSTKYDIYFNYIEDRNTIDVTLD